MSSRFDGIEDIWCYGCKQHFIPGQAVTCKWITTTSNVELRTYHMGCSQEN